MKIAIFQNFLDTIGGAEKVGLIMARELGADIYTTNIDFKKIEQMGFADISHRIFSIGNIPINEPFRQQAVLFRFGLLNLKNKYDFYIINGDWALSSAKKHKPNLWYVNATIRGIWDMREYTRKKLPLWQKPIFDIWVIFNRILNKNHVKNVNLVVSNSFFTAKRVKKYLHRDSKIISPPIYTKNFLNKNHENYWLSVNRIVHYKRIDMQLKAFSKIPEEKLIIIGPHEKSKSHENYYNYIKKICPPNVTIIDFANSPDDLINFYAKCKGFITTCLNEDFGMTAIEAMASGKPVIAPAEGGYLETIINGKTGILIKNIDDIKLSETIKILSKKIKSNPEKYIIECQNQAKNFDVDIFTKKIKQQINAHIRHNSCL